MFETGVVLVILAFLVLGARAAKEVRTSTDYTLAGRRSGTVEVSGVLLGALVGGASTVGTVEMAYRFGLSAWWFTLGGGLGCLILGLWFAGPLRRTGMSTIPELLASRYGFRTGMVTLAASTIGTFLSIVAQFLAGLAMLQGVWPVSGAVGTTGVALAILGFIFLGGLKSYGALGKAKIAFLFLVLASCVAVSVTGGTTLLTLWKNLSRSPWFDLFGRGLAKDLNAGFSLVVGVLTTQIYVQAIFSASSERTAQAGALLSSALMPPLGLLAVWVGMAMRVNQPGLTPSQVLPVFIFQNFPPLVAGCLWSGIAITIVGTAAGLCLGIATNLARDLPSFLLSRKPDDREFLMRTRLTLLALVLGAAGLARLAPDTLILSWSYLSMGLRGAGTALPFALAVVAPGRLEPRWAFISSASGLFAAMTWPATGLPGDPLFVGLLLSSACCLFGLKGKGAPATEPPP